MAVATLTYAYADSTAVLGPLALRAEPGCYDLCRAHAQGMSAPRGWDVIRLPLDENQPTHSADDLMALAGAVRQAAGIPEEAPRRRHPLRVGPAQVVAARFRAKCQRPEHSRRVGIDERERGDSHVGACRPRATPSHVRTLAPRKARAPDCWRMSCESRAGAHHHASGNYSEPHARPSRSPPAWDARTVGSTQQRRWPCAEAGSPSRPGRVLRTEPVRVPGTDHGRSA